MKLSTASGKRCTAHENATAGAQFIKQSFGIGLMKTFYVKLSQD